VNSLNRITKNYKVKKKPHSEGLAAVPKDIESGPTVLEQEREVLRSKKMSLKKGKQQTQ
jgi:hypothetical protein